MAHDGIDKLRELSHDTNDVGQIATVIALRELTTALERMIERQDRTESKIDGIVDGLHTIDKRVARVESIDHQPIVNRNTQRIEALERDVAAWKTRVYTVASAATVIWVVLGSSVENWIQRVF